MCYNLKNVQLKELTDPTIRGFFRRRVPMEGSGNLINAILSYLL
jgi:hypothetical protein